RTLTQTTLQRVFRRWPRVLTWSLALLDGVYQIALWPFRRRRAAGIVEEPAELVGRTDEFNRAAERYALAMVHSEFLLRKPYADVSALAKYLIDAGWLIAAMRLNPGDVVAEIGAGSCWLSHMLNLAGCRTIAIDVSPTILEMGRRVFDSDR